MTDKERIKMLEKRVAELESCVGATACDVLTGYIKDKLKDLTMPLGHYRYSRTGKLYDEATNFERNCKFFLKSVFGISGIRELEYPMLKDAKAIVDMSIGIYKKQAIKKAQEMQGETNERD